MGELVPICNMEVLPGDKFTISNQNLIRLAPMIANSKLKTSNMTNTEKVEKDEKYVYNTLDPHTIQFIDAELHTESKFINFLAYWVTTFCVHHNYNLIEAVSLILNLLTKKHEQKQKSVELNSTEEATEK